MCKNERARAWGVVIAAAVLVGSIAFSYKNQPKQASVLSTAGSGPNLTFQDRSDDPGSTFRFVADAGEFSVDVLEKGKDRLNYRITDDATGKWLAFELLDDQAAIQDVTVSGHTFVARAAPNLTARYELRQDRVKADYILERKPDRPLPSTTTGVAVVQFALTHNLLGQKQGMFAYDFYKTGGSGDLLLLDEDGKEVFRLPQPVITDALGQRTTGTLLLDPETSTLTVAVPRQFLETAVFPITIDPTTIASSAASDATVHSGGRKLIVDRHGNLIAFSRSATNTLTAYYSNDGGKTWINAGNLSTAVNTAGFGVSYDGVTSTIHVAYITTAPTLMYNQVNIAYTANSDITSLTFNQTDIGMGSSGGGAPNVNIIAASGSAVFVPIIVYERFTSAATVASGLYTKQCKMSTAGGVSDCRTAANWTAETTICNSGQKNDQIGGIALAQSRPSQKIWAFANNPGTSGSVCIIGTADTLGIFSSTSTWTFSTDLMNLSLDSLSGNTAATRALYLTALEDTAWSTTNSRVLVVYHAYSNPYKFESIVFNDNNTNTSTKRIIESEPQTGYAENLAGAPQCTIDTTPSATASKQFLCVVVNDAAGLGFATTTQEIRMIAEPLDWSSNWVFTATSDPAVNNAYPMVKTSFPLSYDPYQVWLSYISATSYTAVKPQNGSGSSTVPMVGAKIDLVYSQGTTLMAHTWHLDETLSVTSTILATAPATTSTNPARATFADENDYANATSSNSVHFSLTTNSANSEFPIFTFRKVNQTHNQKQEIGVLWEGQTTNTATDVRVQIFKYRGVGGPGWRDLATSTPAAANTDFTVSATATNDFPVSGATVSDYYGTDPTGGLAASATSTVTVRVYQGAAANETLRTDQFCVFCILPAPPPAPPSDIITQRAYVFQNDSGPTVDTNAGRGTGIAYPVEKGERFTVRFQLDNTGGSLTTQFNVQYDHNDGVWKSATSGEISTQLGISGANGDALSATTSQCVSGMSFTNGAWYEGTATSNSFTIGNNQCTELAFVFSSATSVARSTYNFRLVDGLNGNTPFSSVATPSIVLVTFQERKHSKTGAGAELGAAPTVSNDLAYYLDDTGYAAVAADDSVYDTATSTGSNVPISVFKLRNPYASVTTSFTVAWNGQSSVAPSTNNVFLDIWNNSSNAWLNLATNNSAGANTDFSFNTATSGSALFDASFFTYLRVRQAAGAEALRTDLISMRFGPPDGPGVDRQDILSDSRPVVSANHTVSFIINSGFDASEFIELDWPSDFAFPTDLDCGDADVATGTQFVLSTTSTGCAATATNWGAIFISDSRVFRLTAPSDPGTYIATGTIMTFTIGLNASAQQTGTTQIVNPATVGTYTLDVGGPVGTGRMLVAIIAGQTLSVTIAESLTVTVTGIAGASCTADDGASVTPVDATSASVPFGNISANTFYIACQDVAISTNAGVGYSATCQEQTPLQTSSGVQIPDTTCDGGSCTESVAAAWTNAAKNGFGHTCANQTNHDCDSSYSSGTNFRQFANIAGGEAAQAFMASSTPAAATGRVKFRLSRAGTQAAGIYQAVITYIVTPTY